MLQRVLIATLLAGLAVLASAALGQQVPDSLQLKFDAGGKVPYSATLVKDLVADAQAHGDARRGAAVFFAATSACLSCHKVGKQGGEVGPDLSKVGAYLSPEDIVEGVFWPNRTVKLGFVGRHRSRRQRRTSGSAAISLPGTTVKPVISASAGKGIMTVER
jgi:hypothetical protein